MEFEKKSEMSKIPGKPNRTIEDTNKIFIDHQNPIMNEFDIEKEMLQFQMIDSIDEHALKTQKVSLSKTNFKNRILSTNESSLANQYLTVLAPDTILTINSTKNLENSVLAQSVLQIYSTLAILKSERIKIFAFCVLVVALFVHLINGVVSSKITKSYPNKSIFSSFALFIVNNFKY